MELRSAASTAVRAPRTWVPVAGAALLSAAGLDSKLSDSIADQRPLFGAKAGTASDRLRDAAVGGYLLTALATPGENAAGKLSALGIGAVTLYAQGAMVGGLKALSARQRPDQSNHNSFPSGHTGTASTAATMARHNLAYIDMPARARTALAFGFEGMAIGTAWARVEARKHFAADVLAGYALGHFIAVFAHEAFIAGTLPQTEIAFLPIEGGGAIRLRMPLGSPISPGLR